MTQEDDVQDAGSRTLGVLGRLRPAAQALLVPALAVLTALAIGALLIVVAGGNPLAAYIGLFQGAFGSGARLRLALTNCLAWLASNSSIFNNWPQLVMATGTSMEALGNAISFVWPLSAIDCLIWSCN